MGKRYKRKTGEFLANDAEGKVYRIFEFTEYEDVGSIGTDKIETIELLKDLQTADGAAVNRIDDNTFDILSFDPKTGRNSITVKRRNHGRPTEK
jgi:hypothetical protein